jgi:hypothetical protein
MTFGSRSRRRTGASALRSLFVVALLFCSIAGGMRSSVFAQDASPAAGDACAAIAGAEAPAAAASPAAGQTGTPVEDQATIDAATAAVAETWGCATAYGQTAEMGEVWGVTSYEDGTLGVEYSVTAGMQVLAFSDSLMDHGGTWMVMAREAVSPETDEDSTSVGVAIAAAEEGGAVALAPNLPSAEARPAMFFNVTNGGAEAVHFLIVADSAAVDAAADYTVSGEVVAGAELGADGGMALVLVEGLEPGTYVLAGATQGADGSWTAAPGMAANFEVTEAVDLDVPDLFGTPAG